jgi:uncharacterized membrane protein YeaQ/YmgE (transglycosylase-associated protein family)
MRASTYWLLFGLGIVVALIASVLQHERTPARIALTAMMGGVGAWAGMVLGRTLWLAGPPTWVGVVSAAFVGAVVIVAVEQVVIGPTRVA